VRLACGRGLSKPTGNVAGLPQCLWPDGARDSFFLHLLLSSIDHVIDQPLFDLDKAVSRIYIAVSCTSRQHLPRGGWMSALVANHQSLLLVFDNYECSAQSWLQSVARRVLSPLDIS
jgi:hypothetical protein